MKRIWIPLLLLAMLATSCAKTDLERDGATGSEIRLKAGIDGTVTKALMNGSTGLSNASFVAKESVDEPSSNFSGGTVHTAQVAAATGRVEFASAPRYNLNNRNVWMVAYFPGKPLANNAVSWTIDGKTDVMLTNDIWNAGNFSARNTGETGAKLTFNHQLARIEVVLKAESGASYEAVKSTWGNISKIEFVNAPSVITYSLAGKPATATSAPADFALLADYDGTAFAPKVVPPSTNTVADAVAMLAPVAPAATASFVLRVTATGNGAPLEAEVPVSLDGKFAPMMAGYTHTVRMTLKAAEKKIEVTASSIDAWEGGNTGGTDIEAPSKAFAEVGYYYYDDGSASASLVADKTPLGVVFWVNPDNDTNFKICSMTQVNKAWCLNPSVKVGATAAYANFQLSNNYANVDTVARQNGAVNTALLKKWIADATVNTTNKTLADFPAFAYCDEMADGGKGWYLPAPNEMQYIYCAFVGSAPMLWTGSNYPTDSSVKRTEWNRKFTDVSGGMEFQGIDYWCATEHSGGSWNVYFQNGTTGYNGSPTLTNGVRCIKEIK